MGSVSARQSNQLHQEQGEFKYISESKDDLAEYCAS